MSDEQAKEEMFDLLKELEAMETGSELKIPTGGHAPKVDLPTTKSKPQADPDKNTYFEQSSTRFLPTGQTIVVPDELSGVSDYHHFCSLCMKKNHVYRFTQLRHVLTKTLYNKALKDPFILEVMIDQLEEKEHNHQIDGMKDTTFFESEK